MTSGKIFLFIKSTLLDGPIFKENNFLLNQIDILGRIQLAVGSPACHNKMKIFTKTPLMQFDSSVSRYIALHN